MDKSRCLGLVGGLGVGATVYYYEKLAKALEAQGRVPDIAIVHAQTRRVFEYVEANDRHGLAEYLTSFIRRLKAAGAEVAAIPAVSPHYCLHELRATSPLPVISIFDPLNRELAARSVKRAAVFGASFVMESDLFGEVRGVEMVKLQPQEMDYVHQTYVELARTGQGSREQHEKLTALAQLVLKRDGAEVIILAGTDFAALFNESNTEFPYIDCAALHVKAILQELLR